MYAEANERPVLWRAEGYIAAGQYTPPTLYYYVGETVQNANLINAGAIAEALTLKVDKHQAANASMPSNKHINLTLGASGTNYTAPDDGWLILKCNQTAQYGWFNLIDITSGMESWQQQVASNFLLRGYIPCAKGQTIKVNYQDIDTSSAGFYFIYAKGAQ